MMSTFQIQVKPLSTDWTTGLFGIFSLQRYHKQSAISIVNNSDDSGRKDEPNFTDYVLKYGRKLFRRPKGHENNPRYYFREVVAPTASALDAPGNSTQLVPLPERQRFEIIEKTAVEAQKKWAVFDYV